jgi:hypothetical protein
MTAPIIEHDIAPDPRNDPDHPIPHLNVIDVHTVREDGGADLCIVVASPLQDDQRSHTRLLDKIEGYLGYINSAEFADECGTPTPDNTSITVMLHPDTAPGILELLERSHTWVTNHHASLVVGYLDDDEDFDGDGFQPDEEVEDNGEDTGKREAPDP